MFEMQFLELTGIWLTWQVRFIANCLHQVECWAIFELFFRKKSIPDQSGHQLEIRLSGIYQKSWKGKMMTSLMRWMINPWDQNLKRESGLKCIDHNSFPKDKPSLNSVVIEEDDVCAATPSEKLEVKWWNNCPVDNDEAWKLASIFVGGW